MEQYEKVCERARAEFVKNPSDSEEVALGGVICSYAYNLHLAGQLDKAEKLYRESETIRKKFAGRNSDDYESLRSYSVNLYRLANLLESGAKDEATSRYAECLEIRRRLAEKNPDIKNEALLAVALARTAETESALELARRLDANEEVKGSYGVRVARAFVQCSRFVEDAKEKELLVKRGLASLQKAIAGGFSDKFAIETEPDFQPVAKRTEFREMIDGLNKASSADSN